MRKYTRTGKIILNVGTWLSGLGIALNATLGITDTPEPSFSIPLIVIGIILIIMSNLLKVRELE